MEPRLQYSRNLQSKPHQQLELIRRKLSVSLPLVPRVKGADTCRLEKVGAQLKKLASLFTFCSTPFF